MTKSFLLWSIVCIAYITYRYWSEPKPVAKPKKLILDILVVLIVFPLLSYLMPLFLSDKAQREESFRKQALEAIKDRNIEIENYKNRLVEIHKSEFHSSTPDAEKWADNFIATLQIKRDKKKEIEQENKREIEKETIKLPILFEYIVSTFDGKISALAKRIQGIKITGISNFELFHNPSSGDKKDIIIRKILFENGNSIELILSQGLLEKEKIRAYPKITCREISKKIVDNPILFSIQKQEGGPHTIYLGPRPLIENISFELSDDTFLNEGLRTRISEAFRLVIETTYLR